MSRSCRRALRVMSVGFAIVAPAFGDGRDLRDDQVPYGPDGTIGRGTDSALYEWAERSGIKLYGSGPRDLDSGHPGIFSSNDHAAPGHFNVPRTSAITATAPPYRTNRSYQPGDGYCYPLYYNPATRAYFYYPVRP